MIVNKITNGCVIQEFDTEVEKFVSQKFVADNSSVKTKEGNAVDDAIQAIVAEHYLPFEMDQPNSQDTLRSLLAKEGLERFFDALADACLYMKSNSGSDLELKYKAAEAFCYAVVERVKSGVAEDKGLTIGEETVERVALNPSADLDVVVDSVICDRIIRQKRQEFEKPKEFYEISVRGLGEGYEEKSLIEGKRQIEGIPYLIRDLKGKEGIVGVEVIVKF